MSSESKAAIEELQVVLSHPDFMKEPDWDPFRDILRAAHNSTNGSAASIPALSETVACVARVLTLKELREADRLDKKVATKLAEYHLDCPGKRVEPAVKEIRDMLQAHIDTGAKTPDNAVADASANQLVTPFGTIKGPIVRDIAKYLTLGAVLVSVLYLLMLRQDERLRKNFTEQVMPVAVEIARNHLLKSSQEAGVAATVADQTDKGRN